MHRFIAILALSAVLLAGCGSSGGDDETSSTTGSGSKPSVAGLDGTVNDHGTTTATGGKVEIELDDKYFGPTYIKAEAGTKLTLELKNEGSLEHNFTLTGTDVDVDVEAGKTASVDVTVPDASTVYFCEYHKGAGMQGAFVVT